MSGQRSKHRAKRTPSKQQALQKIMVTDEVLPNLFVLDTVSSTILSVLPCFDGLPSVPPLLCPHLNMAVVHVLLLML